MIENLIKKMREKEKLKKEAQKKYNSMTLEERNAYEQIINRHSISFIGLPYAFFKFTIDAGLFFIITSFLFGIELNIFRMAYSSLVRLCFLGILYSFFFALIFIFINKFRLNKLKLKILKN